MKDKIMLEIVAGEGGKDSKLFMHDMVKMYSSYCKAEDIGMECL